MSRQNYSDETVFNRKVLIFVFSPQKKKKKPHDTHKKCLAEALLMGEALLMSTHNIWLLRKKIRNLIYGYSLLSWVMNTSFRIILVCLSPFVVCYAINKSGRLSRLPIRLLVDWAFVPFNSCRCFCRYSSGSTSAFTLSPASATAPSPSRFSNTICTWTSRKHAYIMLTPLNPTII